MKEKYLVVVEDRDSVDDSVQIYEIDSEQEATDKFKDEVEYQRKNKQEDSFYKEHSVFLCKILSKEEIPSNPSTFVQEKIWTSS